jgi:hypothetical protein
MIVPMLSLAVIFLFDHSRLWRLPLLNEELPPTRTKSTLGML